MAPNLDDDADASSPDTDRSDAVATTPSRDSDDSAEFVARVIVEQFGGPALCEFGRAPTVVAARRIAQSRTGRDATPLEDAAAAADLSVPTVARAENALLDAIGAPGEPAEVRRLTDRVERCRQVLVATARDRAGAPRLTTVLCGDSPDAPDPEDVEVPDDVDPLPPAESAEELKAYYHRLRSDLRCARLGFRLYEAVVEAELGSGPQRSRD
ncbi:hypothetical protein [Natronoarchaeum rubrum]|uniref:hypothetical protein n=1 Tax=Natronoarchaeum rubrum TaxID=755311 RepID=UPI00211168F4|nr:hypothetical protein [Natronoarchaeum rubrum]HMB49332.1 hypothetical protein [Natronoarchaeum rubrum]